MKHVMRKTAGIAMLALLVGSASLLAAGCATSGSNVSPADMQKRQQALANSDHLIVPGQRIGPIRLGMGMDEVVATLGQPDYANTAYGWTTWKYVSLNMSISFPSGAAPGVNSVSAVAWNDSGKTIGESTWADVNPVTTVFQTANGIGLGSSTFDVKRGYASSNYTDGGGYSMDFTGLGIAFWSINDRRVTTIIVCSPK